MAKLTNKEYISALQTERFELRGLIRETLDDLESLESYLASSKFAGTDADFVHVSTDMFPKVRAIRSKLALVEFATLALKESL